MTASLTITSPAFNNGKSIPEVHTCEGQNTSPALSISGVPPFAKSLALIMEDPDAVRGTFTHWLVWNIPANTEFVEEGKEPPGSVGFNDAGTVGYHGPCPPSGSHRYIFRLLALDCTLSLNEEILSDEGSTVMFKKAIAGHVIDEAELVGLYQKKK